MSSSIVLPSACCFLGILVFLLQTDTAFLLHLSQCPQAPVKKSRNVNIQKCHAVTFSIRIYNCSNISFLFPY